MTIEFQCEEHSEKAHCAMVQLSGTYKPGLIRQIFADMEKTVVTLRRVSAKNKPREFFLTAAEADAFVEAWEQFKDDIALYEAIEADRKNRAEKAEMDRQVTVWKQVEQLAASIPGLEIIAREDERWDEDKEEYVPSQCWTVRHKAIDYSDIYNYDADQVLTAVQNVIEHYNQRLQDVENQEKANWEGSWPSSIVPAKKFLATHRAFMAHKTAPLVEQQA